MAASTRDEAKQSCEAFLQQHTQNLSATPIENDQVVAYWLSGLPYSLEFTDVLQRKYLKPIPAHTMSTEVFQQHPTLFQQEKKEVNWSKQYFRDGRAFYFIENRTVLPTIESIRVIPPPDCYGGNTSLRQWVYTNNFMYKLICKGYKPAEALGVHLTPGECTKYGTKISKSLIRIASTRIFAEPEQSIMELPVNSVDSYNPDAQVGKFGMGFFSILYWLVGHPERFLSIESFFGNARFYCVAQERGGELKFDLKYSETNVQQTGTIIRLHCDSDPFTSDNVDLFKKQLNRLAYIKTSLIAVRESITDPFVPLNPSCTSTNFIYVQINTNGLYVEDFAQGMSLDVLLTKLFVPSVSTKTIQASLRLKDAADTVKDTGVKSNVAQNKFVILVRSVAIVSFYFDTPLDIKYELIVELPGNTRIPVSRDDIILTPVTRELFTAELNRLLFQLLQLKTVCAFQLALEKYILLTPNTENKKFVSDYLKGLSFNANTILVNYKYFKMLQPLDEANKLVEATSSSLVALEDYLNTMGSDKSIFLRKKVLIVDHVPGGIAVSAELSTYLFVHQQFVATQPNWSEILPSVIKHDRLFLLKTREVVDIVESHYLNQVQDVFRTTLGSYISDIPQALLDRTFSVCYQIVLKVLVLFKKYQCQFLQEIFVTGERYRGIASTNEVSAEVGVKFVLVELSSLFLLDPERGLEYIYLFYQYVERFVQKQYKITYGGIKQHLQFRSYNFDRVFSETHSYLSELRNLSILNNSWFARTSSNDLLLHYTFDWAFFLLQNTFRDGIDTYYEQFFLWSFESPVYLLLNQKIYTSQKGAGFDSFSWSFSQEKFLRRFNNFMASIIIEKPKDLEHLPTALELITFQILVGACNKRQVGLVFQEAQPQHTFVSFLQNFVNSHILDVRQFLKNQFAKFYSGFFYNSDPVLLKQFIIAADVWGRFSIPSKVLMNITQGIKRVDPRKQHYAFKESQFITYVMKHEFTNESQFENVRNVTKDVDFQIIELAINEGSTKSFANAVLTETLQNSIDAIREHNPEDRSIELYLKQYSGRTGFLPTGETALPDGIVYEIVDYVGIPFDGIVSLMIPFLSSKESSPLVTGEMGSGFFNVYRKSLMVTIETCKNGTRTFIEDSPMLKKERVVDLDRLVKTSPCDPDEIFTKISVFIERYPADEVFDVTSFVSFIRYVIGLIDLTDITITFNEKDITLDTTFLHENELFSSKIVENNTVVSYLLTKEIPFAPLYEFVVNNNLLPVYLLEEVRYNVVVNMKHRAYLPVQTRSKVNMIPEVQQKLNQFLLDTIYKAVLQKIKTISDVEKNIYFSEYTSPGRLSQVCPNRPTLPVPITNITNIGDFMLYYCYPGTQICFYNLLFLVQTEFTDDTKLSTLNPNQESYLLRITNSKLDLKNVLVGWLKSKNVHTTNLTNDVEVSKDSNGPSQKTTEQEVDKTPHLALLTTVFQLFVNIFWELGEENVHGISVTSTPIIKFSPDDLSFYNTTDNTITLTQTVIDAASICEFLHYCKTQSVPVWFLIETNRVYIHFLENILSSGEKAPTLIHELEHARRQSSHTGFQAHGPTTNIFKHNDTTTQYGFDEGALAVYSHIISKGLYNRFFVEVKALLQ